MSALVTSRAGTPELPRRPGSAASGAGLGARLAPGRWLRERPAAPRRARRPAVRSFPDLQGAGAGTPGLAGDTPSPSAACAYPGLNGNAAQHAHGAAGAAAAVAQPGVPPGTPAPGTAASGSGGRGSQPRRALGGEWPPSAGAGGHRRPRAALLSSGFREGGGGAALRACHEAAWAWQEGSSSDMGASSHTRVWCMPMLSQACGHAPTSSWVPGLLTSQHAHGQCPLLRLGLAGGRSSSFVLAATSMPP